MVTKKYIAYDIRRIQWYIVYPIVGHRWAAACRPVNTDTVGHCIKDELKTDRPRKQKTSIQGDSITAAGKRGRHRTRKRKKDQEYQNCVLRESQVEAAEDQESQKKVGSIQSPPRTMLKDMDEVTATSMCAEKAPSTAGRVNIPEATECEAGTPEFKTQSRESLDLSACWSNVVDRDKLRKVAMVVEAEKEAAMPRRISGSDKATPHRRMISRRHTITDSNLMDLSKGPMVSRE
ncbi:hypothetical protein B0H14DRAFT_3127077 [Mycena olivaceomarginata]|nr:hypothetical protein B0H14DRAFT_3127077 [Mycena olivaceomarginata]